MNKEDLEIAYNEQKEEQLNKLLAKLRAEPLAEEREELGMLLMRNKSDLTQSELDRYN